MVIMCQLYLESMSTNSNILAKVCTIEAEGPKDAFFITKILQWIHQHDRVTVKTLRSRYVTLKVIEVAIGPGTRQAECTIRAAAGTADDFLNALKLIKEIEKQ